MKGEPKRRALGKGLSSLIPEAPAGDPLADTKPAASTERSAAGFEIAVADIRPNPHQPRERFSEEEIESLAESIRTSGILQPLIVRPEGENGYTLIAGERRLRAAKRVGLTRVPAIVRRVSDERLLELALIENIQRDDLRPIETARAFRALVRRFGLTQAEVATRVGKPRSTIANFLRLLDLPASVLALLEDGSLTMGHGRALASLADPREQSRLAETAARRGWSVREVEDRARAALSQEQNAPAPRSRRDPNVVAAERELSRCLAAKVRINQARTGRGRIQIRFANDEDLDRVYRQLLKAGVSGPS